jgi:hypothetical protein
MSMDKLAEQEDPRGLKHLAIHVLVKNGFLVFGNIAAKGATDVVVGLKKDEELRTAGIRIKTSSLHGESPNRYWKFSEEVSDTRILRTPFFYIFCCENTHNKDDSLIEEPIFLVIPATGLKNKTGTFDDHGNFSIQISENQPFKERDPWRLCNNNFKIIIDSLKNRSQATIQEASS